MSIASEITRLYGVRSDIFTAITNKGVTVPSDSQLDDAPTLIASISGGGGGGAYTLDYTNPNQYCSFVSNPNCARSGATITPVFTLTNNYVLDNLTLNGNNIQGNSFTMPATDSIVGMVVHQIVPIKLRIAFNTWNDVKLYNLRYNGNVPTFLGGIYHWGNDNRDVELSSSDLDAICNQYSPFKITGRGNGSYIELSLNFTSFDTTTDYFTWSHNWMYTNVDITATVMMGNTVLVTETYTCPGDGSQLDVRIPEVATCYGCGNQTLIKLDDYNAYCSSCDIYYGTCPECGELGYHEYDEYGTHRCDACGYDEGSGGDDPGGDDPGDLPEGWDYCPNCGAAYDGEYCGSCGYPDNDDPDDDPLGGEVG